MSIVQKLVQKFDEAQQAHSFLGFPLAVIKKYGDDETAYESTLITYYGFLSLFPLIIVATAVLQLVAGHNERVRTNLLAHISQYVPFIGGELQHNIHSLPKAGLGLVIALLVALYGARSVADAIRHALNHVWHIPRSELPNFVGSTIHSFAIIFFGGGGLVLASFLSGTAAGLGRSGFFRIFSSVVSFVVLLLTLWLVFELATAKRIPRRILWASATIGAAGLQILQSLSGYVITHELKNLSALYGAFAVVLGLLFWIYLQTQVVLYAAQIGAVYNLRLWPRSLELQKPTPADEKAYKLYAKQEHFTKHH